VLVRVDDGGQIEQMVPLWSPKGMLNSEGRVLVACYSEVRAFSPDLNSSTTFISDDWCNDLHSLRPSSRGILLAVSGVDAAVEFSSTGNVLWQWWAVEHGFATNRKGEPWALEKQKDHRRFSYPIELQSTHINAIAELDESTYIATLLHRDVLISIDRATGRCSVLLEGLGRPHAVRVIDRDLVTLADTTAGDGVIVRIRAGRATVADRVHADTRWLHDAYYNGKQWLLVDGANSRVVHVDETGRVARVDNFDSEWCLYEVLQ
jgi:hypothetical protein